MVKIPFKELAKEDYLILEYINEHSSVSKQQLHEHLDNKIAALDYRLSVLAKAEREYKGSVSMPIANTNFIVEEFNDDGDWQHAPTSKNSFHLSEMGKACLQSYQFMEKYERKKYIRNSILTPIIVTLLTNAVSHVLPELLQLILKLLS